jgi:hypothetical protein
MWLRVDYLLRYRVGKRLSLRLKEAKMDCIACSVGSANGMWFAYCGATRHGPYLSDRAALRIATSEALRLRRHGRSSRITVQNGTGETSAEYCICPKFQTPNFPVDI